MKNIQKKLLIDLKEIKLKWKNEPYYQKLEDIPLITNLLIDYANETQDRKLEDFTYKFFQEDLLEEYVKARFEKRGASEVIKQLQGIPLESERFYLDNYENLNNADSQDVESRLDDIIYDIEREMKKD